VKSNNKNLSNNFSIEQNKTKMLLLDNVFEPAVFKGQKKFVFHLM
jgi:hypothetical protein